MELYEYPNIGKDTYDQLLKVGIKTYSDLKKVGSKNAWLMIQSIDSSACIHRLYALEGAIRGVKKSQLEEDIKADLKEFYNSHKLV